MRRFFFGIAIGIILSSAVLYFVCIRSLSDTAAADARRAAELQSLADGYHTDALAAEADIDRLSKALDSANERIRNIIGTSGVVTDGSRGIAAGLAGDLEIARRLESGLSKLAE